MSSRLSRSQFLASLAAAGVTSAGAYSLLRERSSSRTTSPLLDRYLVLIVLDGFRPDYQRLAPMPVLDSLMAEGTVYDRAWVGQLESLTPTGHVSLVTGAFPKHHGIIGFQWRDPNTGQPRTDGWPHGVFAGALERDLARAHTHSLSRAVKSVDRNAKIVALSSEKVYAADAMGSPDADYILYHHRSPLHRNLAVPSGLLGHVPPADFLARPHLRMHLPPKRFTDWDYLSGMLAVASVEAFLPRVLMVNLPCADVYGHAFGPSVPSVMGAIARGVDQNLGRIVAAYRVAGIFEKTVFVVTADHGMVPNTHGVGYQTIEDTVRRGGDELLLMAGHTAAYVYVRHPNRAPSIAAEMAHMPGAVTAYHQEVSRGRYRYVRVPGAALDPATESAYQYLLNTFAGPLAPDAVAPYRENTISRQVDHAHGDHGGLNWEVQHIPLVLSGPGVRSARRSHFPARLVDAAPTMLRLLGLPAPRVDGSVLADCLSAPSQAEVKRQAAIAQRLTAHQNALIAQSRREIAEDHKAGRHPPPPLPITPAQQV